MDRNYQELKEKVALKSKSEKIFSIEEARSYSKKLIRKLAKNTFFPAKHKTYLP